MVAEGRREGGSKESRGETNMSHTHTHTQDIWYVAQLDL